MSTNLIINENTNIRSDSTFYTYRDFNNDKISNYNFIPNVTNETGTRDSYMNSTGIIGIMQSGNNDIKGLKVDESTLLRNGEQQSTLSKKELDTRLFPGAPYMMSGQSLLKNPDLSSRLKYGEDTRVAKSANVAASYAANNFIPLIPSIEDNVQNVDHIIPTYWVRGGMSSRSVIRNIDYLKSCGIKK